MNEMLNREGACSNLLFESKFEAPQLGLLGEKSFHAQLGVKLRKTFELPSAHSEPAAIRELIRRIGAKLDGIR